MLPINDFLQKIKLKEKDGLETEDYFLGLVVDDKKVQAAVWHFVDNEGKVLAFGSWENWGGENAEELVVAADSSIASAVANLPAVSGQQPTKVILGLPDFWVEGAGVKKSKIEVLQFVCKKLLLKSLGFVVTQEAIAHLLKKEEGENLNLVLVNIEESEITVSLIIQGKFLGSKIVGRSNSLALDLEEGLLRFNFEGPLPARILLLGVGSLEEEKQALLSYPWVSPDPEKKLNFLQFPKVEVAEENFMMSAVILSGSRELKEAKKDQLPSTVLESQPPPEADELTQEPQEEMTASLTSRNFGFIKGEDVLKTTLPSFSANLQTPSSPISLEEEKEEETAAFTEQPRVLRRKTQFFLSGLGSKLRLQLGSGARNLLEFLKILWAFLSRRVLATAGVVLMVLAVLIVFFLKVSRSEVKLLVQAQKIEKEFDFTVSSEAGSVDSEKMVLPGKEITVTVTGKKSAEVTGKKVVGDKATGEIVIYNGTDKPKTLAKGSVLVGPGGLKFILTQEVTVPARTTDLNARPLVDKWGEQKAPIEAEEIGTQYNLPAKSSLTLSSLPSSSFLVENPTEFTGGSSREIQAVSKEDRLNLQEQLSQEMEAQAMAEIKTKVGTNEYLLTDSLRQVDKTGHFDGEIGDERSALSLEGKYSFTALCFRQEDFDQLIKKELSSLVPAGYQPQPVKEEKNFVLKEKTKGIYSAKVIASFLPEIESDKVVDHLYAKKFSQGEAYLKTLPQVVGIEISFQPKFFSFLHFFPLSKQNITLREEAI